MQRRARPFPTSQRNTFLQCLHQARNDSHQGDLDLWSSKVKQPFSNGADGVNHGEPPFKRLALLCRKFTHCPGHWRPGISAPDPLESSVDSASSTLRLHRRWSSCPATSGGSRLNLQDVDGCWRSLDPHFGAWMRIMNWAIPESFYGNYEHTPVWHQILNL